jgi:pimeloyl-ACP methyl ester carboxylesterase
MPVATTAAFTVEYEEAGHGATVVLLHSSVSGNKQWRALVPDVARDFHVVAPNLFGYGATSTWPADRQQTLADHVALVDAAVADSDGPVHLVGHSFGGAVALEFARTHPQRVGRMVLLEPNPFAILGMEGRLAAFGEVEALYADVQRFGAANEWQALAARFADYFNGDGSWAAMSDSRRATFASLLPPNVHEWDSVMYEPSTVTDWGSTSAEVLIVRFGGTRRALSEIVDLFVEHCPSWSLAETPGGGHMAPLSQPDQVNPIITEFLRRSQP